MALWPASSSTIYGVLSMEKALPSSFSKPFVSLRFESKLRYSDMTITTTTNKKVNQRMRNGSLILCSSDSNTSLASSSVSESPEIPTPATTTVNAPVMKKRKRYRKQYPGESKGITEEMRFVAMRLRNIKGKYITKSGDNALDSSTDDEEQEEEEDNVISSDGDDDGDGETWEPSMEGFLKYLVDSRLIFNTIERIIDKSDDVAYAYFRKTGLERSEGLSKDLEWFRQQDIVIPESSTPGVSYAKYLEELAEKNAPLFLCHFYNIYFSHIAGGQVITKQVSQKLLEGKELEFYRWEGDASELLKGVREKLNTLGEHWSRDEKNKCLREVTKSFRFMGQIVRLIIL